MSLSPRVPGLLLAGLPRFRRGVGDLLRSMRIGPGGGNQPEVAVS